IQDVESHNIYGLLTSVHLPSSLKWHIIKGGSRDHARTPMQWNGGENAGFTTGRSWLKVNANYKSINAENNEVLDYYRKMLVVRKEISGDYELVSASRSVTVYRRGEYTIYLNHSDKAHRMETKGTIVINNYSTPEPGLLRPWEAVVTK
ncbi:MAG: hypothetical protein KBS81_04910, partial [Spirochaetales bacterium]|nr:hypothetical protein [Candidatus Physcosoma equi]